MESPLSKIKDWYNSLPIDQRIDIGAMIGHSCPGFSGVGDLTDTQGIPDAFIGEIEAFSRTRMNEVGIVLLLRSAIEFFFISQRCSKQGWKETEQLMKQISATHESNTFSDQAQKIEFRAKQWFATCDKWKAFRDKYLTDSYLESYLNERS